LLPLIPSVTITAHCNLTHTAHFNIAEAMGSGILWTNDHIEPSVQVTDFSYFFLVTQGTTCEKTDWRLSLDSWSLQDAAL